MTDYFVVLMPAGVGARCEAIKVDAAMARDSALLMKRICELVGDKVAIQVKITSAMVLRGVGCTAYCGRVLSANEPNVLARQFLDANCIATGPVAFVLKRADGTPTPLVGDADEITSLLQDATANDGGNGNDNNGDGDRFAKDDGLNVYSDAVDSQCLLPVESACVRRQSSSNDDDGNNSLVAF